MIRAPGKGWVCITQGLEANTHLFLRIREVITTKGLASEAPLDHDILLAQSFQLEHSKNDLRAIEAAYGFDQCVVIAESDTAD